MTWKYAYTSHIWPSVLTVIPIVVLAVYIGHRRNVPGVGSLAAP